LILALFQGGRLGIVSIAVMDEPPASGIDKPEALSEVGSKLFARLTV